jgi:hypothetical protein
MLCIKLEQWQNCFIFNCVSYSKQTLWFVLANYVLMLYVCMQLYFWTQLLKAFACAFITNSGYVCFEWRECLLGS